MSKRLSPSILLAVSLLAPLHAALAQVSTPPHAAAPSPATTTPASYDVVSIHEHAADDHSMMWRANPDGFTNANVSLENLASAAFNIKLDLVSGGPSWVYSKGFDLSAKLLPGEDGEPVKLTGEQRDTLLRAMLADRFHLKAHVETRILPTYDLIVAKGGLRMKPSPPQTEDSSPGKPLDAVTKPRGTSYFSPGRLQAYGYETGSLASQIGYMVGKTVVDKTGVTGFYDFTLEWTPEEVLANSNDATAAGTEAKPDIFTALQEQLGLKLVPTKGPVKTLVIDHAEMPTAN